MSPTERPLRIAVVGDNCIDLILPPVGQRLVGGNAVNVGVQLARLGAEVGYFGAVGRDADGRLIATALRRNGVGLAHLVERDLPTARTTISVDAQGDRYMDHEAFGACDGYAPDAAARAALAGMDHVHIGWLNDGGALRALLSAAGVSVSQDVSVNAAPEHVGVGGLGIAFASHPGSHAEARALADGLMARGARGVVVTRGASGSSAFLAAGSVDQAAPPVVPVDTTGAGDGYIAGFLYALLSGAAVPEAAAAGAALAAETCLHPGGFPQEPAALD